MKHVWIWYVLATMCYIGLGLLLLPITMRIFRVLSIDDHGEGEKTTITPGGTYALMIFWPTLIGIAALACAIAIVVLPLMGLATFLQIIGIGRIFTAPILIARMTAPKNVIVSETNHEREVRWSTGSGAR
jgi:hypothetical protein